MVIHQTKSMNPMPISFDTFLNKKQKPRAVSRRKENIATAIAAHHHMVNRRGDELWIYVPSAKIKQRMCKYQSWLGL